MMAVLAPLPAASAPIWPNDCTRYYQIGDLSEAYQLQGEGILCFETLLAGPHAVQGGAADDLHLTITSLTGGSFRIGNPGHQVHYAGGGTEPLGTGNLAGESFHFDAGTVEVDITRHDGIDLLMPIWNRNPNVTLCVRFSDAGVVLPGANPCRPAPGQPPWMPPNEDDPPANGPLFPIGEVVFPGREWTTGGIVFDLQPLSLPSTPALVLLVLPALAWSGRQRRLRQRVRVLARHPARS